MRGQWITYSEEELRFLKQRKNMNRKKLCLKFNLKFKRDMTSENITQLMLRRGWKTGRTGRFEKGHVSVMPEGFIYKPNSGCFENGSTPANRKPLWSERITKDGYIEIKVAEKNPYTGFSTRYRLAHSWIWEESHGRKIPKGFVLAFIDGDKLNCEPDNLELISRNELCRRNQLHYSEQPAEMKPTVKALAKLYAKIGTRETNAEPE